jgi:ankyrin repeat protein
MNRVAISTFIVATCSLLLASCADPDEAKLPLSNILTISNPEKVKALLASGEKVDAADKDGTQAIHRAAEYGSPEIVEMLLSAGAKVDAEDKQGNQPLIFAVEVDNVKTVKTLLSAGAKVDVMEKHGLQPIHLAAGRRNSIELVKTLLAAGADVNAWDRNGDRPLHWAARQGNPEMAKLLLTVGAKVDAVDRYGDQPLHWAARYGNYGNTEIVNVLLAAGAKTDEPNKNGDSPNDIAKHIGPTETDKGNLKGNLDEATINYFESHLYPMFIRAKLCSVPNGPNGCVGKDIIICHQSNSLSCDFYGMSNEDLVKEVAQSMRNSGLRIRKITFWRSSYHKTSVLEKPIYEFDGGA